MAYRIITIRVLWIREFDKFIFCVCHTRKTVQASGSPMFFLLLKGPPTLGDQTDGVWAALARAWPRSSRGTGGPRYYPLRGGTADVVAARCHGRGPSAARRPFSEPSSRTGVAPELAIGAREATGGPRYYRLPLTPRASSRVLVHVSGPSVACRPFSEPSSTAGAASELARRRADRSDTGF